MFQLLQQLLIVLYILFNINFCSCPLVFFALYTHILTFTTEGQLKCFNYCNSYKSPVERQSDFNSFPHIVSYVVQVQSPFPWCADRFRVSIQCVVRSPSLVSCCMVDFGFPYNGNIACSPSLISTQSEQQLICLPFAMVKLVRTHIWRNIW